MSKEKHKCVKCGADDWERFIGGSLFFQACSRCKKCGYVYIVVDYITTGKIGASKVTVEK